MKYFNIFLMNMFKFLQKYKNVWLVVKNFDMTVLSLVGWVILRIYVALAIFQPYRDLEAGDNQSLKS